MSDKSISMNSSDNISDTNVVSMTEQTKQETFIHWTPLLLDIASSIFKSKFFILPQKIYIGQYDWKRKLWYFRKNWYDHRATKENKTFSNPQQI